MTKSEIHFIVMLLIRIHFGQLVQGPLRAGKMETRG